MSRPWYRDIEGLVELEKELVQSTDNNNVIPLILNIKKKYPKKISSAPPTNISTNSCFIVDLSKLENPEDVLCDDLGAWSQSTKGKKYYKVHKTDSICNHVTKAEKILPVASKLFADLTRISQMKVSKKWLFVLATLMVSFL